MAEIHVLEKSVIDQIAAGEVVERPSSIVKELVENAVDAGASAVTVEIRNGGIDLVRVTDNGCGIEKSQVPTAFLAHATSKIRNSEDLSQIRTLGFRGEALSSIAAVTELEIITKRAEDLTGTSYKIAGGIEKQNEEIGAPDGTTFLVRNIFFNTPVRRKFLKTAMTEASYCADLMERFALSHPEISFRFINNGNTRLSTSGNGKVKDVIYTLYGRDTANEVQELSYEKNDIRIEGFIGKPVLSKGSRGYENYFINGRYVKSGLINKAIEEAYAAYMMQHRFPFAVLYITMPPEQFDVNVHPTKMELRFQREPVVYDTIYWAIKLALTHREYTVNVSLTEEKEKPQKLYKAPEPFEKTRIQEETPKWNSSTKTLTPAEQKNVELNQAEQKNEKKAASERETAVEPETEESSQPAARPVNGLRQGKFREAFAAKMAEAEQKAQEEEEEIIPVTAADAPVFDGIKLPVRTDDAEKPAAEEQNNIPDDVKESAGEGKKETLPEQQDLFSMKLVSDEGMKHHKLIGQIFDTYWIVQLNDTMYIMDQHAAHEKVLYERKVRDLKNKVHASQMVSPPVMVTVSAREELVLNRFMDEFSELGYEISCFGGKEYAISAVPADLYGLDTGEIFKEILADMEEEFADKKPDIVLDKLASMSCKAAIKGGNKISFEEADALIAELLTLENPYACPHGRPTLITITKRELEKKFKRIV